MTILIGPLAARCRTAVSDAGWALSCLLILAGAVRWRRHSGDGRTAGGRTSGGRTAGGRTSGGRTAGGRTSGSCAAGRSRCCRVSRPGGRGARDGRLPLTGLPLTGLPRVLGLMTALGVLTASWRCARGAR